MADASANPVRSPETREQLIAIALPIFARHGYDGASTRDIAQQAGVALSAISYHFGGKPELFAAVADRAARVMFAPLEAIVAEAGARAAGGASPDDAGDMLVALVDAVAVSLLTTGHEAEAANQFGMRELAVGGVEMARIGREVIDPIVGAASALLACSRGGSAADHTIAATTLFGPITLARLIHNRRLGDMTAPEAEGLIETVRSVSRRNAIMLAKG
ncbi:TetR/AcrR family transcriptional regulator [Sphingomonas sp. Root710]|uniref:TetR/AcrR family transcriptional regulator n=1 Tax=Sphingomonas sp. Root710 TaxID=1736594 RepID=UPI000A5A4421|nr:TetR family transcriptional regulator [Sphingomonas sp. Root710]